MCFHNNRFAKSLFEAMRLNLNLIYNNYLRKTYGIRMPRNIKSLVNYVSNSDSIAIGPMELCQS